MPMQKHVQILAILHIVHSALLILIAVVVFGILMAIGTIAQDRDAFVILGIIGTVVATILFIISIPGLVGGIGLLKYQAWARILTLIVGFLKLVDIPLGTALGIYTIWVLMKEDTERLFNPVVAAPAEPQA
jgi:hypothetical protein